MRRKPTRTEFLSGASTFYIKGPRDINGNRRELLIDARHINGEPVNVTAEEFRRLAVLAGLRDSLNAEDIEAIEASFR